MNSVLPMLKAIHNTTLNSSLLFSDPDKMLNPLTCLGYLSYMSHRQKKTHNNNKKKKQEKKVNENSCIHIQT